MHRELREVAWMVQTPGPLTESDSAMHIKAGVVLKIQQSCTCIIEKQITCFWIGWDWFISLHVTVNNSADIILNISLFVLFFFFFILLITGLKFLYLCMVCPRDRFVGWAVPKLMTHNWRRGQSGSRGGTNDSWSVSKILKSWRYVLLYEQ